MNLKSKVQRTILRHVSYLYELVLLNFFYLSYNVSNVIWNNQFTLFQKCYQILNVNSFSKHGSLIKHDSFDLFSHKKYFIILQKVLNFLLKEIVYFYIVCLCIQLINIYETTAACCKLFANLFYMGSIVLVTLQSQKIYKVFHETLC